MKKLAILVAMVAASLLLATLVVIGGDGAQPPSPAGADEPGLPWQISVLPGGDSRVMGLTLSTHPQRASTLADVRQRFGPDVQIAIVAAPGEDGSLEAFVDPAQLGFVSGKLVVTAQLDAATLRGLRERAVKSEFMESTTRKHTLAPADQALALAAPIAALSFIPQAKLDAQAVEARFGPPTQRVPSNGHLTHLLYPDKGLDVIVDTEGKELLQYVAPAAFERLSAPLAQSANKPLSQPISAPSTQP